MSRAARAKAPSAASASRSEVGEIVRKRQALVFEIMERVLQGSLALGKRSQPTTDLPELYRDVFRLLAAGHHVGPAGGVKIELELAFAPGQLFFRAGEDNAFFSNQVRLSLESVEFGLQVAGLRGHGLIPEGEAHAWMGDLMIAYEMIFPQDALSG